MFLKNLIGINPKDKDFEKAFSLSDNKNEFIRELVEIGKEKDLLEVLPLLSLGNRRTINLILEENNFKKKDLFKKSKKVVVWMNPKQKREWLAKEMSKIKLAGGEVRPSIRVPMIKVTKSERKKRGSTGLWDTTESKKFLAGISMKVNYGRVSAH